MVTELPSLQQPAVNQQFFNNKLVETQTQPPPTITTSEPFYEANKLNNLANTPPSSLNDPAFNNHMSTPANEQQQQQQHQQPFYENKLINTPPYANKNDTIMAACSLCKNNASCMVNDEAEELVCICPLGFSGYYCEQGRAEIRKFIFDSLSFNKKYFMKYERYRNRHLRDRRGLSEQRHVRSGRKVPRRIHVHVSVRLHG
jgi:hypothetical protein